MLLVAENFVIDLCYVRCVDNSIAVDVGISSLVMPEALL